MRLAADGVMQALDMPEELKDVQDAYWLAQREWEELDKAYRIVVSDVLKRLPDQGVSNQESKP